MQSTLVTSLSSLGPNWKHSPMCVCFCVSAVAEAAGVREPFEGLRVPDIDTLHADSPRLGMAAETPRISAGRAVRDVKER